MGYRKEENSCFFWVFFYNRDVFENQKIDDVALQAEACLKHY